MNFRIKDTSKLADGYYRTIFTRWKGCECSSVKDSILIPSEAEPSKETIINKITNKLKEKYEEVQYRG